MRARVTRWLRHYLMLVCFLGLQLGYWHETRAIKPDMAVVPNVPGKAEVKALSFGDEQFYFRVLAFMLQNAGDTYGRFTSLRYYDMFKLYHWFNVLDTLDARSDMIPSLATYYYSQTQNTPDVRYVVDYLYAHAVRDVARKWWWLVQSIYLTMHKLEDQDLALKVVTPLVDPAVPVWAQQMTAVVHEKRGEMEDALRIMEVIRNNAEEISDQDLKYMRYFVEERLEKLEKMEKNALLEDLKEMEKKSAAPPPSEAPQQ